MLALDKYYKHNVTMIEYPDDKELRKTTNGRTLLRELRRFANRVGGNAFKEGLVDYANLSHGIGETEGQGYTSVEFSASRKRYQFDGIGEDSESFIPKETFEYNLEINISRTIDKESAPKSIIEKCRSYYLHKNDVSTLSSDRIEEYINMMIDEIEFYTINHRYSISIDTEDGTIVMREHIMYYVEDQEYGELIDAICVDHSSDDSYELLFDKDDADLEDSQVDGDFMKIANEQNLWDILNRGSEEITCFAIGALAALKARVYKGKT